jgi:hypothetical protein
MGFWLIIGVAVVLYWLGVGMLVGWLVSRDEIDKTGTVVIYGSIATACGLLWSLTGFSSAWYVGFFPFCLVVSIVSGFLQLLAQLVEESEKPEVRRAGILRFRSGRS